MVDFAELKRFFIFNLIGSVIIAALIAVIAVLFGEFGEFAIRAFATLFFVIVHSLVSLAFIWNDKRDISFHNLHFFINVVFVFVVISFLTSVFGVWEVLKGDIIWKLYLTYGVIIFSSLHANLISKALHKEGYMNSIIYANYIFISIVGIILLPIIFIERIDDFIFRLLGASAIIDGTLTILTIIFYKLYMHKHPHIEDPSHKDKKRSWISILIWLVVAYIFLQFVFSAIGRIF